VPGNGAGAEQFDRVAVEAAAAALRRGAPVVLPTDTVYGVAVLASTPDAIQALFELKGRSSEHPLAVLVDGPDMARELILAPITAAQRLMARFWPGPVTLVFHRREELSHLGLGGDGSTIGVRCPDHPLVRELARRLGPIVTTSANRHGEPTPVTAAGAAAALVGPSVAVIDGGVLDGPPSTVVDCTTDPPHVLREGVVSASLVLSVAEGL
jgi:L-threonylcarbamoyladenylate synthase